jgi:hypothetical protein
MMTISPTRREIIWFILLRLSVLDYSIIAYADSWSKRLEPPNLASTGDASKFPEWHHAPLVQERPN